MIFIVVTEDSPLTVTHVREPGNAGESGPVHGTVTQIESNTVDKEAVFLCTGTGFAPIRAIRTGCLLPVYFFRLPGGWRRMDHFPPSSGTGSAHTNS
jgi:hypothetical protein